MSSGPDPRYDGLAAWYADHVAALPAHRVAHEAALELLGPGPGRCLDLGCGAGFAARGLVDAGWQVVGVDVSADQLAAAGDVGAELVLADAASLPFADGSFDAVVSVLTHTDFDDPGAVFAEARRVLGAGGRFVYVGSHPCFVAPSVQRAGVDLPVLHEGYRRRGWWQSSPAFGDGIRPRVGVNHLPLADFLNAVVASGLVPVEFREPGDDDYPFFLALLATK